MNKFLYIIALRTKHIGEEKNQQNNNKSVAKQQKNSKFLQQPHTNLFNTIQQPSATP